MTSDAKNGAHEAP